jgi:hypothetical protein
VDLFVGQQPRPLQQLAHGFLRQNKNQVFESFEA